MFYILNYSGFYLQMWPSPIKKTTAQDFSELIKSVCKHFLLIQMSHKAEAQTFIKNHASALL